MIIETEITTIGKPASGARVEQNRENSLISNQQIPASIATIWIFKNSLIRPCPEPNKSVKVSSRKRELKEFRFFGKHKTPF